LPPSKPSSSTLRERVELLAAQVQELQARLAKDSHNSNKPPASDGLARKTRSLRKRSGKKPGGQIGHRGETLRLVALPDAMVEHRLVVCAGCQEALREEALRAEALRANAPVVARERRQVQDLPSVRLGITEHQALRVRCHARQQVSGGDFPPEAPSRAQDGPRLRALAVYLGVSGCIWWSSSSSPTRGCGRQQRRWRRWRRRSRGRSRMSPCCTATRRACAAPGAWRGRLLATLDG